MRQAIVIRSHGGPEVLRVEEVPAATAAAGEVRVRVSHVALNHLDVWVRRGVPGHDFRLPRIPGSDVVGTLDDGRLVALHPSWGCGACPTCLDGRQNRCAAFRIRGETADGGCATEVIVPAWQCLPVPPTLDAPSAAALPLALLTAWHMLVVRARVQRGERVLVQSGASGVGSIAIQVARLLGAEVHATAGTAERRAALDALGARAWPYEAVGAKDGVRNADVVVESTGRTTWAASLRALAWGGRLVTCGATSGADVGLDLRAVFFKQQAILGSTMGTSGDMVRAWSAVATGAVRPVVDRVMAMSEIGAAHGLLERREIVGKVVLVQDLAS